MNEIFANHRMLPHRQAAQLLTRELGDFIDWHFWLVDNRRGRNSPFIQFHRESRRIFYKLADIQMFAQRWKARGRKVAA